MGLMYEAVVASRDAPAGAVAVTVGLLRDLEQGLATARSAAPAAPVDDASWKHSPADRRPDKFREGPLVGINKNFCLALGEKPTRNHRRLEQKAKSGCVWVVAPTPTARQLNVWFYDLLECQRVAEALSKLTHKQPAAAGRGKR